jgi:hypothetical protein
MHVGRQKQAQMRASIESVLAHRPDALNPEVQRELAAIHRLAAVAT